MARDNLNTFSERISIGELMHMIARGESFIDGLSPEHMAEIWREIEAASRNIEVESAEQYLKVSRLRRKMKTSREAFVSFLPSLLAELGIDFPDGVLKPPPGRPGRPRKLDNARIYAKWLQLDCSGPASQTFARACFGQTFITANCREKKRMIDRCYRIIKRVESTKSTTK